MTFIVLGTIGAVGLMLVGLVLMLMLFMKKAAPDEALVVTRPSNERIVSFTTFMALPLLHEVARVSLREQVVTIERQGDAALRTRDDHQVELVATFRVRINKTTEDVLTAARTMGSLTGDPEAVRARFLPAFVDALETVTRDLAGDAIDRDRGELKDRVIEAVGTDLDGYSLVDLAITGVRVLPGSPYRG